MAVALGTLLVACGGEQNPTDVKTPPEHRTPADSAAFLAQRGASDTARMRRLQDVRRAALEASVEAMAALVPSNCDPSITEGLEGEGTGWMITVCQGDTVTVTITSAECSGIGDVLYFGGVLTLVVSHDACFDVGATTTVIASSRGPIWPILDDPRFGYGTFRVEGALPQFTVYVEDGYGDGDFDDNILTIRIGHPTDCAPYPHDEDLENPAVRDWLNTEFLRGAIEGNEPNGWIYKNDATGEYVFQSDLVSPRSACWVDMPATVPSKPGHTVVAGYHGHILPPGSHPPASCGLDPRGTILNGPSAFDRNATRVTGVKHYIVDENELHTVQPDGTDRSQEWTEANHCRP
jgi:hypothetical protein